MWTNNSHFLEERAVTYMNQTNQYKVQEKTTSFIHSLSYKCECLQKQFGSKKDRVLQVTYDHSQINT